VSQNPTSPEHQTHRINKWAWYAMLNFMKVTFEDFNFNSEEKMVFNNGDSFGPKICRDFAEWIDEFLVENPDFIQHCVPVSEVHPSCATGALDFECQMYEEEGKKSNDLLFETPHFNMDTFELYFDRGDLARFRDYCTNCGGFILN
jgi:hypothetical protein